MNVCFPIVLHKSVSSSKTKVKYRTFLESVMFPQFLVSWWGMFHIHRICKLFLFSSFLRADQGTDGFFFFFFFKGGNCGRKFSLPSKCSSIALRKEAQPFCPAPVWLEAPAPWGWWAQKIIEQQESTSYLSFILFLSSLALLFFYPKFFCKSFFLFPRVRKLDKTNWLNGSDHL